MDSGLSLNEIPPTAETQTIIMMQIVAMH